ncbi:hypothetical protein [Pseudomonas songnenensis]|uniref:Cation/multidrug efflux pump n=1 Tax=Pseudomonas songnenensis TaxID=1176259 RepID=A0A482U4W6_9PSED|nr:hypothetical protein [Pseudomonas songnenensis]MCQ4299315.1 hypothetical protein [Pseudomonas songnenensis]RMH94656.1 hypothetical protein EA798_18020 [Pseudomonas songnenensis]RYJ63173.1 hypothetical protein EJA06_004230 [Pseudomonas songnenensis]
MQYLGLAIVIALLAVIVLLVALRLLLGGSWLMGWLRGTCGFVVLALAGLIGLIGYDISTYASLPGEQPLVTLTFQAQGPQRYEVRLDQGKETRTAMLEGDLWQLDLHMLRWKSLAELIGLESGYRLERLSGRYLAVEQQNLARYGRVELSEKPLGVDIWQSLELGQRDMHLVDAQMLRVDYMPIADGAVYTVELAPTGLIAKPANAAATEALKNW